jgi:hypothetical protein
MMLHVPMLGLGEEVTLWLGEGFTSILQYFIVNLFEYIYLFIYFFIYLFIIGGVGDGKSGGQVGQGPGLFGV